MTNSDTYLNPAYGYNASTYTGGTTINGGTISIASDTSFGPSGGLVINGTALAPSTLQATATFSTSRSIKFGPIGGSGVGNFDVTGVYALTLAGTVADNTGAPAG